MSKKFIPFGDFYPEKAWDFEAKQKDYLECLDCGLIIETGERKKHLSECLPPNQGKE